MHNHETVNKENAANLQQGNFPRPRGVQQLITTLSRTQTKPPLVSTASSELPKQKHKSVAQIHCPRHQRFHGNDVLLSRWSKNALMSLKENNQDYFIQST